MSRKILTGSIGLLAGLTFTMVSTGVGAAGQATAPRRPFPQRHRPAPPPGQQTAPPARPTPPGQASAPTETPAPPPNRDPAALGGLWKYQQGSEFRHLEAPDAG